VLVRQVLDEFIEILDPGKSENKIRKVSKTRINKYFTKKHTEA